MALGGVHRVHGRAPRRARTARRGRSMGSHRRHAPLGSDDARTARGEAHPARDSPARTRSRRPVRVVARPRRPRHRPLSRSRERVHDRVVRATRGSPGDAVPGDQGPHPRDRPVRAGAPRSVVVRDSHRGREAILDLLPAARARHRRGRAGARRRQRPRGGPRLLRARRARREPEPPVARLLDGRDRRRSLHDAHSRSRHRRGPSRCHRGRALRHGVVGRRRTPLLHTTRRRVALVSDLAP